MSGITRNHCMVTVVALLVASSTCFARVEPPRQELELQDVPANPAANEAANPAVRPRLVAQLGHAGWVRCAAFSPDERFVLTGGLDGTARLWEVATYREIRVFERHASLVTSVAFSPDGRLALTASWDDSVRIWDTASGREIRRFDHPGRVNEAVFSSDGTTIVTACDDRLARSWSVETGAEIRRFAGHDGPIDAVAVSPDGKFVLTGSRDRTARLWEAATGTEIRRFEGHAGWVVATAFSSDGRSAFTASSQLAAKNADNSARLWDVATGRELQRFSQPSGRLLDAALSSDGQRVLTAGDAPGIRLWGTTTGAELRRIATRGSVSSVSFSSDGRRVLSTGGRISGAPQDHAELGNVETGQQTGAFVGRSQLVRTVTISPDGRYVITGGPGARATLWDTSSSGHPRLLREAVSSVTLLADGRRAATGGEDGRLIVWDLVAGTRLFVRAGHDAAITSVTWSADERYLLTASLDGTAQLWNATSGDKLRSFAHGAGGAIAAAVSADARYVLTGGEDAVTRLWDAATGTVLRSFQGNLGAVTSVAFSADGRTILTGSKDSSVRMWETAGGMEIRGFRVGTLEVISVAFSSDGRAARIGTRDGRLIELELATGKEVWKIDLGTEINSVAMARDGHIAVAAGDDGTTWLVDLRSARALGHIVHFSGGSWAVIDEDGRFDTNDLEGMQGLQWVVPDEPFRPLPLEIFMRDYFEPGLLGKLVDGRPLAPVRDISSLNRAQPDVAITDVRPEGDTARTATVRVEITPGPGDERGVYDVRLFRDGRIVGSTASLGKSEEASLTNDDLAAWRAATRVDVDRTTGKARIDFRGVHLPAGDVDRTVSFSAYAFNSDRVKSTTQWRPYEVPAGPRSARGRAYIVSVGVNASENPRLNLRFAAGDARRLQALVGDRLEATRQFEAVIRVPLVSDYRRERGTAVTTEALATKANLKTVLDLLAGRSVDPAAIAAIAAIPNAAGLRRALPGDLVLVTFSGHGYADGAGEFYLVPYDVGPGEPLLEREGGREIVHGVDADVAAVPVELLTRCISSRELSSWLADVDAGATAIVVDACQSAASVEAGGFRPGPLGSRGLGQLAYDKGMLVLAATQSDNVALESGTIRQGLLTYALLHDGLEQGLADADPADGRVTLREWLAYGVERVPALYAEMLAGRAPVGGGEATRVVSLGGGDEARAVDVRSLARVQRPVLFDFAVGSREADVLFAVADSEADLAAYVGRYAIPTADAPYHFCDITYERGLLRIRPSRGLQYSLLRRSKDAFVFGERRDQHLVFERDETGAASALVISGGTAPSLRAQRMTLPRPSLKGNVTLMLDGYPDARIVSVAGTFNDGDASRNLCAREGDQWVCRVKLRPGRYDYAFVIDGQWITDPANPERGTARGHSLLEVKK